jgi:hypothetical protein
MRIVSRSMAQVAMRLSEPDKSSQASVSSLSEAVRREISAMDSSIERVLTRAGELEATVRGEVVSLERVYQDNEARMRGLINDLRLQREALEKNAGDLSASIESAHAGLAEEIAAASNELTASITDAGNRVTRVLGDKGIQITEAVSTAGEGLIQSVATQSSSVIERLNDTNLSFNRSLAETSDRLTSELGARAISIQDTLLTTSNDITRTFDERSRAGRAKAFPAPW